MALESERCSRKRHGSDLLRSRVMQVVPPGRAGLLRRRAFLFAFGLLTACSGASPDETERRGNPVEAAPRSAVEELVSLGDRVKAAGDLQTALALYLQASTKSDGEPRLWLRLGATLSALGRCKDAVRSYRSVLKLEQDNVDALVGLGRCWILLGEPQAGKSALLRAAAEDRGAPGIYQLLGISLDLLGQHAEAQRAYRSGLDLVPKDVDLRANLALSLALSGDHDEAVGMMESLLEDPSVEPGHELNFALVLSLCRRDAEAERIAKAVLHDAKAKALLVQFRRIREIPSSRERALEIGMLLQKAR